MLRKLKDTKSEKLVVDPVMIAKSGARLLRKDAEKVIIEKLLPAAFLVTPNVFEAEIISGMNINNIDDAKKSAKLIHKKGMKNVLVKGGHLSGEKAIDILFDGKDFTYYEKDKIDSKNTHGTGCTFSAAITAGLAKGTNIYNSIKVAKDYITRAIKNAPANIGKGHGPLNFNIEPLEISIFEESAEDFDKWFSKNKLFLNLNFWLKSISYLIPKIQLVLELEADFLHQDWELNLEWNPQEKWQN